MRPVNPRASKIRPYFPGYLFLRSALTEVGESTFHWMPYSQGLVRVGGELAPVADFVVRALRARVAEIWQAGGLVFDSLKKGDRVFIREGLFEGYRAIFDGRLPGSERVRVLLKMLNDRYLPLEVGVEFIERDKQGAISHQRSARC